MHRDRGPRAPDLTAPPLTLTDEVEHFGRSLALRQRRPSEQPPDRLVRDARGLDIA
ncbi:MULTISPECIES: hypothetical protein [Sorangium]|uniref:hypothetical protein n=1 Tax=Sorangium TaxID=39643 RepID=UPI003D9C282F